MNATVRWRGVLPLILAVAWLAMPTPVLAHADVYERIAALNEQLAASPDDPALYLKRGELHRVHRNWDAALADYGRAAQLAPALPEVDYYTGRMWLEAGRPGLARPALDRFLSIRPHHADARLTRARALARLGERPAAVADLTHAISRLDHAAPEYYLERARLLVAEGPNQADEALRGIDEGIARLGPLVTFIEFAVGIEATRGRPEAALARVDALPDWIRARPAWLARRGDRLLAAARQSDARAAYAAALAAIEALPTQRRAVKATAELETRLRGLLAQLTGE